MNHILIHDVRYSIDFLGRGRGGAIRLIPFIQLQTD